MIGSSITQNSQDQPRRKEYYGTKWTFDLFLVCFSVGATISFVYGYGIGAPGQYELFYNSFMKSNVKILKSTFGDRTEDLLVIIDFKQTLLRYKQNVNNKKIEVKSLTLPRDSFVKLLQNKTFVNWVRRDLADLNISVNNESIQSRLYQPDLLHLTESYENQTLHIRSYNHTKRQEKLLSKGIDDIVSMFNIVPTIQYENAQWKEITQQVINGIGQTMFIIGCFIGAVTCPYITMLNQSKHIRIEFYTCYIIAILSSVFTIISYYKHSIYLFLFARILHGYSGGASCVIAPSLLTEISPKSLRGQAGTFHQIFLAIGILIGQILGIPVIFGTDSRWHFGLAAFGIMPLLGLITMPFLLKRASKELLHNSNENKMEDLIAHLYEPASSKQEKISRKPNAHLSRTSTNKGIITLLKDNKVFWQTLTAVLLLELQALCGINAIFFYVFDVFQLVGIQTHVLPYAALLTGTIEVIAVLTVLKLIDKIGRRSLIIFTTAFEIIIFILMTTLININEKLNSIKIAWICVILTMAFIFLFCCGLGPVPFVYGSEVFRSEYRVAGMGVAMCVNYICNALLAFIFPVLNWALKGYVFTIFAIIIAINMAVLYFKMPETKNKTVDEIEQFWNESKSVTAGC